MTNERRVVGSTTAVDEDARRKKAGWLPWALLGLGALALLAFLVLRNAGDEGDDAGVDATDEASSSADEEGDVGSDGDATADELADGGDGAGGDGEDGASGGDDGSGGGGDGGDDGGDGGSSSATTAAGGGAAGSSGGAAGGGAAGSDAAPQQGTVTAEGTPILPAPAEGLGAFADKGAEARGVLVQSVVADEGFWVGATEADRLFVFFAADNAGSESRVKVEQGQTISFDAIVKPLPADFAPAFGIDEAEGAGELEGQGHYLEIAPDAVSLG